MRAAGQQANRALHVFLHRVTKFFCGTGCRNCGHDDERLGLNFAAAVTDSPYRCIASIALIRRAAFVVPTWPRDFSFTKALLDSYATQSPLHADLILVFSFGKDVETFKRSFGDAALKIPGCVPTVYSGERKLMEFDPIFYKKWWTIYSFAKRYDYFLPVDTECRFIRQYSVAKFAMQYFERKRFHCSRSQRITYAISDSMSLFNNSEKIALRPLLRNKTCLVWFNEIPVVEITSGFH